MATYDDVIGFVERMRSEILKGSYAKNRRDVGSALDEVRKMDNEIYGYEDKVKDAIAQTTDAEKTKLLKQSYGALKDLCLKKLHCLETVSKISDLENNVSNLSQELDLKAHMLTDPGYGGCDPIVKPKLDISESSVEAFIRDSAKKLDSKSSTLTHPGGQPLEKNEKSENLQGFISQSAQDCIFGIHDSWKWISSLAKCAGVHLRNGAAYHEFFHEVEESEPWMLDDLIHVLAYFETKVASAGEDETKRLATELERAFLALRQWEAKSCRLWETATRLVPVPLRIYANREPLPARIICDYESKEITVRKNEDVVLLDNSNKKLWKIKNGKGQEGEVPAPVVLLPGPDDEAIKEAVRLRLQLLTYWTTGLKVIGKRLIYFMLIVFKSEYTVEEISALRSMERMEKESLLYAITDIENVFKRYWSDHEGFQSVQERILVLKMILQDQGHEEVGNEELYRHLVVVITNLHQATRVYESTSDEWEKFKAVLEASRSPHLMLILDKWEQLQFVSKDYFSKFWKSSLALDAKDKSLDDLKRFTLNGVEFVDLVGTGSGIVERGHDETTRPDATVEIVEEVEEEKVTQHQTQKLECESVTAEEVPDSGSADDGTDFGVARERKTAETEQLSQAEMEEKKTFHIKSVVNPANQQEISLQEAIMIGVIRPDEGVYVNTVTGETMPIAVAMGSGLIKVMFSNTKRTEEKTSSIGIITVKTVREDTRPYIILWVKDTETGEELTPDEAAKRGILKEAQGFYVDRKTGKKSMITEAADEKLINIEYFGEKPETEVISVTYAVRAVVDRKQKKTVTFNEAVRRGIIDRETGAYVDTLTGERIYVADAIVRGFLKARIVEDPSSLNIDPVNTILIDKTQQTIRDKVLNPLKIISAFKMAAKK